MAANRLENSFSTISPAWCPWVSLIFLKRSISSSKIERALPSDLDREHSLSRRDKIWRRLYSSVRGSIITASSNAAILDTSFAVLYETIQTLNTKIAADRHIRDTSQSSCRSGPSV